MIKQYIILRKDAPTVTGKPVSPAKLAVAASHASMKFLFASHLRASAITSDQYIKLDPETLQWSGGTYTKVLLGAKLKDIQKLAIKAIEAGLKAEKDFFTIRDICKTELQPDPESDTCLIAIGFRPMEEDRTKPLVKKLQLYK